MKLKEECKNSKEMLFFSMLFTFLVGMCAHIHMFTSFAISHDYLSEYYLYDTYAWKISLGRFMEPLLRIVMGDYAVLPWLDGLFALGFIGGAVYFTCAMFDLGKRYEILILTGIYSTNLTVTACIASYYHDLAGDMLALLLACMAAYFWKCVCTQKKWRYVCGVILCAALSLGFYQSYILVTVVLIMIYAVRALLEEENPKGVLVRGICGCCMLLLSGIIYWILFHLAALITGVSLLNGNYNSVTNIGNLSWGDVLARIRHGLLCLGWTFAIPNNASNRSPIAAFSSATVMLYVVSAINIFMVLGIIVCLICELKRKELSRLSKGMIVCLVLVMPVVMNLAYIFSGADHELMHFSFWLVYLLFYVLYKRCSIYKQSVIRGRLGANMATIFCALVLLLNALQISNTVYVKKILEEKSTMATMIRVLEELEDQEGYVMGETPVVIIGRAGEIQNGVPGTENVSTLIGADANSLISSTGRYSAYFQNVLQYPINICDAETAYTIRCTEEFKQMPQFPAKGSVKYLGDILVVKMSEEW